MSHTNDEMLEELYTLIASIDSPEDCKALLGDLCTVKETLKMAQRLKAAKLILQGKTYNQIIDETDISSATLSRVSRCVQFGDGYKKFLKVP